MTVTKTDLARFHGIDGRIALDDYVRVTQFYVPLLENLGLSSAHPGGEARDPIPAQGSWAAMVMNGLVAGRPPRAPHSMPAAALKWASSLRP